MKCPFFCLVAVLPFCVSISHGIDIVIDYTLDSNNFFDTQQKKDALQAAADRYSRIITSSLNAVGPSDSTAGWRIGFNHPGTGAPYEISTAANFGSDPLNGSAPAADEYGFAGLPANVWILYAGGRSLGSAGVGGTGTGTNFLSTFEDEQGPMHRGIEDNTPGDPITVDDLPRWGGTISFDTGEDWHFDLTTVAPFGKLDFYSIALHEIGHALGLATDFNQLPHSGSTYTGGFAIAAFNDDNSASATSLSLVSSGNLHFADNVHKSLVFSDGTPQTVGVVGAGVLQDLLMDPVANFGGIQDRIELTNVDVAALRDVNWSTLATAPPPDIFQPDMRVGPSLTSAQGDGIYGTFGGQASVLVSKKARRVTGVIAVENGGNTDDSYSMRGSRGNRIFRVKYLSGGANVTAGLIAGTHNTGVLSPGDSPHQVALIVRPKKSKIKKVIKRPGQPRRVRYKKKKISLFYNTISDTDAAATDQGLIRVKTR